MSSIVDNSSFRPYLLSHLRLILGRISSKHFEWQGTWKSSFLGLHGQLVSPDCSNLFSDMLYRPFQCSQIDLRRIAKNIPHANKIHRLTDLSRTEFSHRWSDRPFILTDPVKRWPCFRAWTIDSLLQQYGDIVFRAESVDWPLTKYIDYMINTSDENPLYLFDRNFVDKMRLIPGKDGDTYWTPDCFGKDLFTLLGDQRPDSRWLIIGPERSGSTFHKDPNATSAWNAVITGSKYWIMFPSTDRLPPPPGVYVSSDQSEVTSPLSIAEWLLTYHEEARHTAGCREGVCYAGEVLHVPSGWWHLVVNLEASIAITQNFIPEAHLSAALDFLKNKKKQISGFADHIEDPYTLFVKELENSRPDLLVTLEEKKDKKRKWDDLVREGADYNSEDVKTFSFGFGADISDENIP